MGKGIIGRIRKVQQPQPQQQSQQQPQDIGTVFNMLQRPGGSEGGLAASAVDTTPQPTLTSGIQNPIADNAMFGNRTNGSGVMEGLAGSGFGNRFQNNQGMQNQYGIIGGAKVI